jgi:hypothetical protein
MGLANVQDRAAGRAFYKGRCDSVRAVGRSSSTYLASVALLGASGCLLFTDPINKAPEVDIVSPGGSIVRGESADFTANIHDDKDPLSALDIEWAVFPSDKNESCVGITKNDWAQPTVEKTPRASDQPYVFKATSEGVVCVCVQVVDRNGARGQDCERVVVGPATLVATITDFSGKASGQPHSLCSEVHLSAESSRYPEGDLVEFHWTIQYLATDPLGKATQLVTCDGIAKGKEDQHRCFYAAAPGTYTVTMSFTDKPAGAATPGVQSKAVTFDVVVGADTPPSLQQTDPGIHALRIMLSRSTDLGATFQSRTFKVLSVDDDCEPYPVPAASAKQPTQFVWSIYDGTRASPAWVYQANTSDSFTVSQAMFPNALPGDSIKLRVEVRDEAVERSVMAGASACPSIETDICCGPSDCTGSISDRIRWTTWTVQFLP